MEYLIKQYGLQQGALEIQYIEEFFLDFPRKKTATEVIAAPVGNRDHQILMAEAPLPDEPGTVVPVSFKVSHELRAKENDPKLADLVAQLEDCVEFDGRRVLYQWIGGTRSDWRGQGHFRALTEEQEVWAIEQRLRRDPRQDQEPLLRDAQHAGAAALRRRSGSCSTRSTRASRRSSSASASAST